MLLSAIIPLVIVLAPIVAGGIRPVSWLAPTLPVTSRAVRAYGAAEICWRGDRVTNAPPPFVRTAISNQRGPPPNAFRPKSRLTAKRPFLVTVAALVVGPA